MSEIEKKMNEFLTGKFFWDPASDFDDCRVPEILEIRKAQKGFERERVHTPAFDGITPLYDMVDIAAGLKYYQNAVSRIYGVSTDDLFGTSRRGDVPICKRHYYWGLKRYFPNVSVSRLAKLIGLNHTTIIKLSQRFEKAVENHADKIREIDNAMWND